MSDQVIDTSNWHQVLEDRVVLVCPSLGYWRGRYKLPDKETEVSTDGKVLAKDSVTTPQTVLLNNEWPVDAGGTPWKKRFQKMDTRLAAIKEKYSLPFGINGVRIVPKHRMLHLFDELYGKTIGQIREEFEQANNDGDHRKARQLQDIIDIAVRENGYLVGDNVPAFNPESDTQSLAYELHAVATEFCRDWENIKRGLHERNETYRLVESRVPATPEVMRGKFYIDVVPIELSGGTSTNKLTQNDLEIHSSTVRAACQRKVEEAVEEMLRGPREQLAEALGALRTLINRNGRVTNKSFNPVRAAIAKIRMFDFVANDTLLSQIEALENQIGQAIPANLDAVQSAQSGFDAALNAVMVDVANTSQIQQDMARFGRATRHINLT